MSNAPKPVGMNASPDTAKEMFASVELYRQVTPELRSTWTKLASDSIWSPYQTLFWYEAWLETAGQANGEEPLAVVFFDASAAPTMILPLVTIRRGPIVLAKFPGGKHANYNFPIIRRDVIVTEREIGMLRAKLFHAKSGVDLYWFDALPFQWDGYRNPLLGRPIFLHGATSSVVDLTGAEQPKSFAFNRRSSDRRLVKLGASIDLVSSEIDVDKALAKFFAQKSEWFRARKLPNSFGDNGLPGFFRRVFSGSSGGELYALNFGDHVLATAGVVANPKRASLMFISYDLNHELTKLSPGTHLMRWLLDHMLQRGVEQFDFGLGDAEYKRVLGARIEDAFISMQAMTARGRVAGIVLRWSYWMKRQIKRSPRLLFVVQRLRRLRA